MPKEVQSESDTGASPVKRKIDDQVNLADELPAKRKRISRPDAETKKAMCLGQEWFVTSNSFKFTDSMILEAKDAGEILSIRKADH